MKWCFAKEFTVGRYVKRALFSPLPCSPYFVSDEARRYYLTPPEYRDPPEERPTEHQWALDAIGEFAQCMQTWVGNDDFLYCHWIAESEEDIYRQLDAFDLEGKVVSSMVNEIFQFMSAYRDSNQILRQYPENGDKW